MSVRQVKEAILQARSHSFLCANRPSRRHRVVPIPNEKQVCSRGDCAFLTLTDFCRGTVRPDKKTVAKPSGFLQTYYGPQLENVLFTC